MEDSLDSFKTEMKSDINSFKTEVKSDMNKMNISIKNNTDTINSIKQYCLRASVVIAVIALIMTFLQNKNNLFEIIINIGKFIFKM